jgi:hypothetical protein
LLACQNDTQLKITLLLQRHFEQNVQASIDWLALFYFDYFSAHTSTNRRVELSEKLLEFIRTLIATKIKQEKPLFDKDEHLRVICETLCLALEHQYQSDFTDSSVLKLLLKVLRKVISQNNEMFFFICDRNHFLRTIIFEPLTHLGHQLSNLFVMPPHDLLKHTRLLMELVLLIVTKTGYLRNQYVFTVQVADNLDLVKLVFAFCCNI